MVNNQESSGNRSQQDILRSEENDESLNTASVQSGSVENRETGQHGAQDLDTGRGGTTDKDNESIADAGRGNATETGSGIGTKRNVNGSDHNRQLSH